ncbi:MAG: hypothetical protein ACOYBM_01080 [Dethiobacteria bacterium]
MLIEALLEKEYSLLEAQELDLQKIEENLNQLEDLFKYAEELVSVTRGTFPLDQKIRKDWERIRRKRLQNVNLAKEKLKVLGQERKKIAAGKKVARAYSSGQEEAKFIEKLS